MEQAKAYQTEGDLADKVWQVINTAFRTHPFGTVRAAELQRWIDAGGYDKIVGGDYRRRDDAATPPYSDDFVDAAGYYGDQARGAMETISGVLGRARSAFDDAFRALEGRRERWRDAGGCRPRRREAPPGRRAAGGSTPSPGRCVGTTRPLTSSRRPGIPELPNSQTCRRPSRRATRVALSHWPARNESISWWWDQRRRSRPVWWMRCMSAGIRAFGPSGKAAMIESSKRFAKQLMLDAGIPTARASWHTDADAAKASARALGSPVVIKASGLAAGKGVSICGSTKEADSAIDAMLREHAFGGAGDEILVEEFMDGEELSVFALCDGVSFLPMLPAQDHKRLLAGDGGPNTGGMGAYAPVSIATSTVLNAVSRDDCRPHVRALQGARGAVPGTSLLWPDAHGGRTQGGGVQLPVRGSRDTGGAASHAARAFWI